MTVIKDRLEIDEAIWKDLLSYIDEGQVLPILGQGVMTIAPDNELLMPWITGRLSDELGVGKDLSSAPTLNEVVCQYLMRNGNRSQLVHHRLNRIIKEGCPAPGDSLRQLASIEKFRLFISTTFDPLLAETLSSVRSEDDITVCEYAPNASRKDIPNRKNDLKSTTVYHILGKSSATGNFVVWEDDMMEFIFGLHKDLQSVNVMPNLAKDLADKNLHYLILGLNFSDWLVRFFVRAARQTRLSESCRVDYIADEPEPGLNPGLVMFFGSVDKSLHVFQCDPRLFVDELTRRWQSFPKSNPPRSGRIPRVAPTPTQPTEGTEELNPIFVSYASEDIDAARNFKSQMEAAGFTIWLDQTELKVGNNYESRLRNMIEECSCFVALISQNTESQHKGYFHLERSWAAELAALWAENVQAEFYIPIVVDETPLGNIQREPGRFSKSQRERLPNGQVSPLFVVRMREIISNRRKSK